MPATLLAGDETGLLPHANAGALFADELSALLRGRIAVEQASTFGWERYVGEKGRVIGMHTFGASAPLKELQKKFGFEPDQVVAVAKELLAAK